MNRTSRLYGFWAVALLGLTLLAGAHLRATFAWPALRGDIAGPHLVHAHSHVGFFGWAVLAVCALLTAQARLTRAEVLLHRLLAHGIGAASAAAFIGFALRGYDVVTITLSAVHVALWLVLVVASWQHAATLPHATRSFARVALLHLAGAGLATVVPVMLMVRGVQDAWLQQLGVKLFLTPFVSGFLLLVALGTLYGRVQTTRHARASLSLITAGVLPSTLLYIAAAPPAVWLPWLGRTGMALIATGTLLFIVGVVRDAFARDVAPHSSRDAVQPTRRGLPPLGWLVVLMALLKAALELLAAAGVGASIMHNRAITIAVLHVVLLGVVTPALVLGLRPRLRAPLRTITFAAGLVTMTAAVGVTGWPWAARLLILRGVSLEALFALAAAAGAVSALALLSLFAGSGSVGADAEVTRQHAPSRARQDRELLPS